MNRRFIIAGAAVLIAVAGLGLAGMTAQAQAAVPQAQPSTVSDYLEQLWNAVAEKLGVKRADLDKAVQDAGKEVTSKAVEDGKLTQAQADRMLERLEAGPGFRGLMPWGRRGGMMGGCAGDLDTMAKALGMTVDELTAELKAGKTLDAIAEAKGVDLAAARKEAMKEQINQAVADGQITQAQADWMIQGIEQGYMPGGRGSGFGGHMRGHMFGRGFRGFWGDEQVPPGSPSEPATPNQQRGPALSGGQGNA